jgi:hypothetical protein
VNHSVWHPDAPQSPPVPWCPSENARIGSDWDREHSQFRLKFFFVGLGFEFRHKSVFLLVI